MTLDRTKVIANPGTLTYTPSSGTGGAIGFSLEGVTIRVMHRYEPIMLDEAGDGPIDYINLGGPVFVEGVATQWDTATKAALMKHSISGADFIVGLADVGKKATTLAAGTLSFAADEIGGLQFSATLAVPLSGAESQLRIGLRRKRVTSFPFVFGCLPDYTTSTPTARQIRIYPRTS